MFFEKYRNHQDAKIWELLLCKYETDKINWQQMRNNIFSAVLKGAESMAFICHPELILIRWSSRLLQTDSCFKQNRLGFCLIVCVVLKIKKYELKCTKKQATNQHWNC